MRLLPREEKFYRYFVDQSKYIREAAQLMVDGFQTGGPQMLAAVDRLCELEKKGDELTHEIFQRLNQTFITPLDPEDIHYLAAHLDDVLDYQEDVAYRIRSYRVELPNETISQLCGFIAKCGTALESAFVALNQNDSVMEHCIEINRLEEAADNITRRAVEDLFEHEKDPIQLIKLKEIYELLEGVTDRFEDVTDILQNIVVKNS